MSATRIVLAVLGFLSSLPAYASATGRIIRVNHAATGMNTGTSWINAYTDLVVALHFAAEGDEIWVAAGTYKPAPPGGPNSTSFYVPSVAMYGGFAGDEEVRSQRNWARNVTILSGDLNGDDADSSFGAWDNAKRVVFLLMPPTYPQQPPVTPTLDGFTIAHGSGLDPVELTQGGGVFNANPFARIENCTFKDNWARMGGALCNFWLCDPLIVNCAFIHNGAGGLSASVGGAAIFNDSSGGVTLAEPTIINCTFARNELAGSGQGTSLYYSYASRIKIVNSVLWDTFQPIYGWNGGQLDVSYSCVYGGYPGVGNFTADPQFLNEGAGDVRLSAGSPCIDSGNSDVLGLPDVDIVGAPRRQDDPDAVNAGVGTAPIVDMGAYEFQADCNANGISDIAEAASGQAEDQNGNTVIDECEDLGVPFCFGDGSITECPCGNAGAAGHGCANSVNPDGAFLTSIGTTIPNTVLFRCQGVPNNNLCTFLRGTDTASRGFVFGDGVRCASGDIVRFGSQLATNNEALSGVATQPAGSTRYYQMHYRNPNVAFCPSGTFNISNGRIIGW